MPWFWLLVIYIVSSIVLIGIGIAFYHWFIRRPRPFDFPYETVGQITRFSEQFKMMADHIEELSKIIGSKDATNWKARWRLMIKHLRKVNKFLQKLNTFFENEIYDTVPGKTANDDEQLDDDTVDIDEDLLRETQKQYDFINSKEMQKFLKMGKIKKEDLQKIDWDALLSKLNNIEPNEE